LVNLYFLFDFDLDYFGLCDTESIVQSHAIGLAGIIEMLNNITHKVKPDKFWLFCVVHFVFFHISIIVYGRDTSGHKIRESKKYFRLS